MSLIAQNVFKVYKSGAREVRAVDGVSAEIPGGSSTAILGPSGAGKSTLLHILGGLDAPTQGDVILDEVNIAALTDVERSRIRNSRIGFVFQFYHLLNEFTALENVTLPALIKSQGSRGKGQETKTRATALLEQVGLKDRMTHRPSQLSGGEAQRVAIARALINKPDYLLCDEPTGNLDSQNSASIIDLLFALQKAEKVALVIVTHDESLSKKTGRTIRLKDGKVL